MAVKLTLKTNKAYSLLVETYIPDEPRTPELLGQPLDSVVFGQSPDV